MKEVNALKKMIAALAKPDRNMRIHIVAEHLISKPDRMKAKEKKHTLQMVTDYQNIIQERTANLETILKKEVCIYDDLRGKRSKVSVLRREMVYWRLFHSDGLTIQMIAALLGVSQSIAGKRVGEAYTHVNDQESDRNSNLWGVR